MLHQLFIYHHYGFLSLHILKNIFFILFLLLILFSVYTFYKKSPWKFWFLSLIVIFFLSVALVVLLSTNYQVQHQLKFEMVRNNPADIKENINFYVNNQYTPTARPESLLINILSAKELGINYILEKLETEGDDQKKLKYQYLLKKYAQEPFKANEAKDNCIKELRKTLFSDRQWCFLEFEKDKLKGEKIADEQYKQCNNAIYQKKDIGYKICEEKYQQKLNKGYVADQEIYDYFKLKYESVSKKQKSYIQKVFEDVYKENLKSIAP